MIILGKISLIFFGFILLYLIINFISNYIGDHWFFKPIEKITEDYFYTNRYDYFKIRLKNGNLVVGKLNYITTDSPHLLYQNSRTFFTHYYFNYGTIRIRLNEIKSIKHIGNDK
mgnify:CR=1 FL=1